MGILGGSFNPPHQGHIHASEVALKYLQLDVIWWLVSPGNPLKVNQTTPSLVQRVEWCEKLIQNPRIVVSQLEADLNTKRTYHTIKEIKKFFPQTDFIWLSGTDIAFEFQKWYKWKELMNMIPFAFIGRPTREGVVRSNVFKHGTARHTNMLHGGKPSLEAGQIYWLFSEPFSPISSTLIRSENPEFAKLYKKK